MLTSHLLNAMASLLSPKGDQPSAWLPLPLEARSDLWSMISDHSTNIGDNLLDCNLTLYQVNLWIGWTSNDRVECIHRQIIHNSLQCFQHIIFAIIVIIVTIRCHCPSLSFPSSLYSTGPQPHIFPGLSLVPYRYDPAKLPECALANRQFWIICALLILGNVQSY